METLWYIKGNIIISSVLGYQQLFDKHTYFVVTKFDIHEMGYHMVLNMASKLKSAMNSMPENDRL